MELATIAKSELVVGGKIGEGAQGSVYKGKWRKTGEEIGKEVAIKKLFRSNDCRELKTLKGLIHPHIINVFGVADDDADDVWIVMELCQYSLKFYVHTKRDHPLSEDLLLRWALHAALPLEYLRNHRILHRDIKPENYVINNDMVMKLTDFGVARKLTSTVSSFTALGTWRWMAPEVHGVGIQKKFELSPSYDIFSLGLVLWYLVSRREPYAECKSDFTIASAITGGIRPDISSDCPEKLEQLIRQCWDGERRNRPDITFIITKLREMNENLKLRRKLLVNFPYQRDHTSNSTSLTLDVSEVGQIQSDAEQEEVSTEIHSNEDRLRSQAPVPDDIVPNQIHQKNDAVQPPNPASTQLPSNQKRKRSQSPASDEPAPKHMDSRNSPTPSPILGHNESKFQTRATLKETEVSRQCQLQLPNVLRDQPPTEGTSASEQPVAMTSEAARTAPVESTEVEHIDQPTEGPSASEQPLAMTSEAARRAPVESTEVEHIDQPTEETSASEQPLAMTSEAARTAHVESTEVEQIDQEMASDNATEEQNVSKPVQKSIQNICTDNTNENFIFFTPQNETLIKSVAEICLHHYEKQYPGPKPFKAIFVATERATIIQYIEAFKRGFRHSAKVATIGERDHLKTVFYARDCSVVMTTPQILVNSLANGGGVLLEDISIMIFDECHRTSQGHPHNHIMAQYREEKRKENNLGGDHLGEPGQFLPQIIGLSACPGEGQSNNMYQNILTMCANMDVKKVVSINESSLFAPNRQTDGGNYQDVNEKQDALKKFQRLSEKERIEHITQRQKEINRAIADKARMKDLKQGLNHPDDVAIMCKECKEQITLGSHIVKRRNCYDCEDPKFMSRVRISEYSQAKCYKDTRTIGTMVCIACSKQQLGPVIDFLDDGNKITRRVYSLAIKSISYKNLDGTSEPKTARKWNKLPFKIRESSQ